jgi:hypothetical protein
MKRIRSEYNCVVYNVSLQSNMRREERHSNVISSSFNYIQRKESKHTTSSILANLYNQEMDGIRGRSFSSALTFIAAASLVQNYCFVCHFDGRAITTIGNSTFRPFIDP